ncbi:integrase of prophage domain protein, partial [Escherichia coli DEC10F]
MTGIKIMSRALNKLSDTQLRKINGTPAQKQPS